MAFDVRVRGVAELHAAFDDFAEQLQRELDGGMRPRSRYRGAGAVPFTVGKIRRLATSRDFSLRGLDDGEAT